jgi:dihydropteroate synthase
MGILNVTPDSFSDGGKYSTTERAVEHAKEMLGAGVDIIDVGGESTRPGSSGISAGEELDRVLPVIDALSDPSFDPDGAGIPISIDTQKPEVADEALKHGCFLINDIGAAANPGMVEVLQHHGEGVSVVIMHKLGDPKTMQESPHYEDVVSEVCEYLNGRANALLQAGIGAERIIIDPGLGFGKRFRNNLELMNNLDSLRSLGYPVLVGASRKRFLGELLNAAAENRLPGSLAAAARCYQSGVEIVRVHDVNETVGLFRVLDAMEQPGDYEAQW